MHKMNCIGKRIYFNQYGDVVFIIGEMCGGVKEHPQGEVINYIDVPFGDKAIENAESWHIDVENKKIVVDKAIEKVETEEDKLRREKIELENQLLLQTNKELIGDIL